MVIPKNRSCISNLDEEETPNLHRKLSVKTCRSLDQRKVDGTKVAHFLTSRIGARLTNGAGGLNENGQSGWGGTSERGLKILWGMYLDTLK